MPARQGRIPYPPAVPPSSVPVWRPGFGLAAWGPCRRRVRGSSNPNAKVASERSRRLVCPPWWKAAWRPHAPVRRHGRQRFPVTKAARPSCRRRTEVLKMPSSPPTSPAALELEGATQMRVPRARTMTGRCSGGIVRRRLGIRGRREAAWGRIGGRQPTRPLPDHASDACPPRHARVRCCPWAGPGGSNTVAASDTTWPAKDVHEKIRYVHGNPVRRGLTEHPANWPRSTCRSWEGDLDEPL